MKTPPSSRHHSDVHQNQDSRRQKTIVRLLTSERTSTSIYRELFWEKVLFESEAGRKREQMGYEGIIGGLKTSVYQGHVFS